MTTPPKERTPAAERSARYRANKKLRDAASAAQAAGAKRDEERDAPPPPPSLLLTQVDATELALSAMSKWLQDSDKAAVNQARFYSKLIDGIDVENDERATAKLTSLGQLLTRILHELGGTPTVRMQHELRSMRLNPNANGGDDGDSVDGAESEPAKPGAGAVVTSIKRPAKRGRS